MLCSRNSSVKIGMWKVEELGVEPATMGGSSRSPSLSSKLDRLEETTTAFFFFLVGGVEPDSVDR